MLLALSRLIRFATLMGLALTVAAVGLGRMAPIREARELGGPPVVFVSSYLMRTSISRLNLFDVDQGNLTALSLDPGDGLDSFSASPWIDGWGERHLAGRWSSTVGRGESTLFHGFGLARVSYPSGRMVDRVESDIHPSSPPCWFPGTSARILFTSVDGLLYTYSFEDDPSGHPLPDRAQPRPLRWELPGASRPPGLIQDIAWAAPLVTGRLLVASLLPRESPGAAEAPPRTELWWFRLAPDGSAVLGGGRLLAPGGEATPRWTSFRKPAVATTSDGVQHLACLVDAGEGGLSLAVIPVKSDPTTESLKADPAAARLVAAHCAQVTPAFAADGKWIAFAQGEPASGSLRFSRTPLTPSAPLPSTVAMAVSLDP